MLPSSIRTKSKTLPKRLVNLTKKVHKNGTSSSTEQQQHTHTSSNECPKLQQTDPDYDEEFNFETPGMRTRSRTLREQTIEVVSLKRKPNGTLSSTEQQKQHFDTVSNKIPKEITNGK